MRKLQIQLIKRSGRNQFVLLLLLNLISKVLRLLFWVNNSNKNLKLKMNRNKNSGMLTQSTQSWIKFQNFILLKIQLISFGKTDGLNILYSGKKLKKLVLLSLLLCVLSLPSFIYSRSNQWNSQINSKLLIAIQLAKFMEICLNMLSKSMICYKIMSTLQSLGLFSATVLTDRKNIRNQVIINMNMVDKLHQSARTIEILYSGQNILTIWSSILL